MIYLLSSIGYLVFGFTLIGFLMARDRANDPISLGEYINASLTWPLCLFSYICDKARLVVDVVPFLRKVFGGPKEN